MRALVYPQHGYIAENLIKQLKGSGHQVLCCGDEDAAQDPGAWTAALQQATAVFHVLHGQEQHAKETVLQLLQSASAQAPVTFVGISTPLTWAATPAPAPVPTGSAQAAAAGQAASGEVAGVSAAMPPEISTEEANTTAGCVESVPTTTAGHFTVEDAPRRRPAGSAVATFHTEQLVLRSNRPGRLHTHVVCPGVLYGAGEADDQLHGLWRAAWEGQAPLQVQGSGANRLPTLHVRNLAAFCEALALQQEAQLQEQEAQRRLQQQGLLPAPQPRPHMGRYWLAADSAAVTQQQLVEAMGQLLFCSGLQHRSTSTSLLDAPASPLQLLDLPFSCSSLAQPPSRCCPQGLLGHLPQVLQELLAARNLSPLRILIRGPPAAGKTHLGLRLARLYGLLHVNAASILAELQHMDPDTQKAATTQLSGREGRLSPQLMARLAQHLLLRHPTALKQGWVLEGWPRSLSAAMLVTSLGGGGSSSAGGSGGGGASEAGGKEKGGKRDGVGSAPAKDRRRSTMPSSGGAPSALVGGRGGGRRTAGEDELLLSAVHEGMALQSPDLMPHVLIELDVGEEELQRRVKALAAAEAVAAAAAAAADAAAAKAANSSSAGNGGSAKKPAGQRPSVANPAAVAAATAGAATAGSAPGAGVFAAAHNNLKDFGRRMEAYRQLLQEDATDLAAKRAAVIAAYQAQLAAEAAAAGGDGDSPQQPAGAKGPKQGAGAAGGSGGSKMSTPRHISRQSMGADAAQQLPPEVKLPEHGGFAAYFVDAGAKYIKAANPLDSAAAANAAAPPAAPASLAPSPRQPPAATLADTAHATPAAVAAVHPLNSLEQQLAAEIGPPHNYTGLPESFIAAAAAAAAGEATASSDVLPPATDGVAAEGSSAASGTAAAAATPQHHHAGSSGGREKGAGNQQQQQQLQRSGTRAAREAAAAATAAAEAAVKGPGGLVESLQPDMAQLKAAAEALAQEAAARDAAAVSAAARPLQSSLLDGLMADLMAGLVQVALTRPQDPCQVIVDKLLEAAARDKAAYQNPYDDPTYAVQLAKVEAKAARDAARAAAAAAKAAREQAAAAEASASTGAVLAEGLSPPAAPDSAAATAAAGDGAASSTAATGGLAGSKPVGKQGSGGEAGSKAGQKGGRAAGGRASVAHSGAQPAR